MALEKKFDATTAEPRLYQAWEAAGCFVAGANAKPEAVDLLHHDPTAQRHGRFAHGPRVQQHLARYHDALEADAGV